MGFNTGRVVMLNAQTADETTSQPVPTANFKDWSVVVTVSNATFTSGSVTIEATDDRDFSGTWAILATASEAATVPANDHSSVLAQNTKLIVHGSNLAVPWIRARLNEAVVGGADVTVAFYGRN